MNKFNTLYLVVKGTPGSLGYEREPHRVFASPILAAVECKNVEYGEMREIEYDDRPAPLGSTS